MSASGFPHRPPRSPHLSLRPLRRQGPLHRSALDQQNRRWLAAYAESEDSHTRLHWRNCLVEANLGLVHSVAARFAGIGQLPFSDLVQVGCQGLIRAVEAFDGSRARCLSTFAVPYVRGAIQHELRDRESWIRLPRKIWELRQQARKHQEERRAQGLHPLSRDGLAAVLGCTLGELDEAEILREVANPLSLDSLHSSHSEAEGLGTWLDQLADPRSLHGSRQPGEQPPRQDPQRRAQVDWLRGQLHDLDPLQRDLVLARVLVGCSWVELGRKHGLHPRMAERRCSAALKQLRASAQSCCPGKSTGPGGSPHP